VKFDIMQQPQALRELARFYERGEGAARLAALPVQAAPLLTGMGASLHAAQVATLHLHHLGVSAHAVEATELVFYSHALLRGGPLVFVSQSGASAEVAAVVGELPAVTALVAVTNNPDSPLAQRAQLIIPILAGTESGVATKTYLNTLATLWLLARHWSGRAATDGSDKLSRAAGACEELLASADTIVARWLDALGAAETIVFLGHGPHAATARQAAMILAERARVAACGMSAGAFRHGPIEITQSSVGVVMFAAAGWAGESARTLAAELREHGARVLLVECGRTRDLGESTAASYEFDEFLAPILDIIPAQLFADALAHERGIEPKFRYIGKVVAQL
jgi:glucosamine--fructose-6-phosphate aminotransferase (isomerizing)